MLFLHNDPHASEEWIHGKQYIGYRLMYGTPEHVMNVIRHVWRTEARDRRKRSSTNRCLVVWVSIDSLRLSVAARTRRCDVLSTRPTDKPPHLTCARRIPCAGSTVQLRPSTSVKPPPRRLNGGKTCSVVSKSERSRLRVIGVTSRVR